MLMYLRPFFVSKCVRPRSIVLAYKFRCNNCVFGCAAAGLSLSWASVSVDESDLLTEWLACAATFHYHSYISSTFRVLQGQRIYFT